MKYLFHLIIIGVAFPAAFGQDIEYVPHDTLSPISSPLGGVYDAYKWYQPALTVRGGCVPFPAIGEYKASAGLRLGGARNGNCGGNEGQVYARHKDFPDHQLHGIMYSYYFPKDQLFAGITEGPGAGHRHDWENVVVWVSWDWNTSVGASMSGHGEYTVSSEHWNGSHKSVLYANGNARLGIPRFDTHEMSTNSEDGGFFEHPLANWYQMNDALRYTLNNAVWLSEQGEQRASPKIVDAAFDSNMQKACDAFLG